MPNTKHLIELEFAKKFEEWCEKGENHHYWDSGLYKDAVLAMEEWLSEYFDADNNKEL